jgi:hypothetical protein
MRLGLPLRTRNTIVDVYGVLLCGSRFCQSDGQQLRRVRDRVDVVGQRERHDVGVEPVDHGARLLAGAAVRWRIVTFSPAFACQYFANAGLKAW